MKYFVDYRAFCNTKNTHKFRFDFISLFSAITKCIKSCYVTFNKCNIP